MRNSLPRPHPNPGLQVEARQYLKNVPFVETGGAERRSVPRVTRTVVGKHNLNAGAGPAQAGDVVERLRFRRRNGLEQASPGQNHSEAIGNRSELGRENIQRLRNTDKIRNSAACGFPACPPCGFEERIRICVRGYEETLRFAGRPAVRAAAIPTTEVDVNAPLIRRELRSDLSAAPDGYSFRRYDSHIQNYIKSPLTICPEIVVGGFDVVFAKALVERPVFVLFEKDRALQFTQALTLRHP